MHRFKYPGLEQPRLERFRGNCCLAFEGQQFTPTDGDGVPTGPTLWVYITPELEGELVEMLGPRGCEHVWFPFEIEFLGRSELSATGAGHLGFYAGWVTIEQLISAKVITAERWPSSFGSIREALRSVKKGA